MQSDQHTLQDIARSSYADMLNDDERNRAYNNAIELCVEYLVKSTVSNPDGNRYFKCCDIGTGSGLLSMMITRAFQRHNYDRFHIEAFEAFPPMAECAKRVIEQNHMSKHITVIANRSDLHKLKEHPQYDLLVAELLDTELIGEGCLEAYRHAVQNLCSPQCLFVPHAARIHIEPVASARLFSRHAIDDLEFRDVFDQDTCRIRIDVADEIKNCAGMPEIDDIQASALKEGEDFARFSRPQMVFEFIFGELDTLKLSDSKVLTFPIEQRITETPVIVMWWDIVMYDSSLQLVSSDPAGCKISKNEHSWELLSCAPTWAKSAKQLARDEFIRDTYGRDVWREHWIQGIYYFSSVPETKALVASPNLQLPSNNIPSLTVYAYHDSHSMWFDLKQCTTRLPQNCTCGVHRMISRSQLASLSDPYLMRNLLRSTLEPYYATNSLSTTPGPTYITGKIEFQRQEASIGDTASSNVNPAWKIHFDRPKVSESSDCDGILLADLSLAGEIPWSSIMTKFLDSGEPPAPVTHFQIKFTQVQFDNLNRIRTNIGSCEGFNLSHLDDMINYSSKHVDKELESHYLWEYPCIRMDSNDYVVFNSNDYARTPSHNDDDDIKVQQRDRINSGTYWCHFELPIMSNQREKTRQPSWQKGWALVFWAELTLKDSDPNISLGPVNSSILGENMAWNRNCKQLVYFLHDHPIAAPQTASKIADERPSIRLDVGLNRCQLIVQRAVDYNTSPLKSRRMD